ncbi:MAG TPA: hypothetical protein VG225_03055 [Terracidiphilus sp.]|nr:hypothetical protein [Terracidiphilus sp.]
MNTPGATNLPLRGSDCGSNTLTAILREKELKGWRREKKLALIHAMNPAWVDLARDWYEAEPADYQSALDRMDV